MLDASNTGNGTAVEEPPFDTSQQGSGAASASNAKFSTGTGGALLAVTTQAYESIKDPVEWAKVTGQAIHLSGMFGCNNPGQGYVIAMDAWTRRVPIIQYANTYHFIEGKLSMRADTMLARFREAGGRCEWKHTGEDGKQAVANWTVDGKKYSIAYTIEEAQLAGASFKPGSNWSKRPGEMLRARCTSKAIRMLMPEVISGVYCPEDFEAGEDGQSARLKPDAVGMVPVANEGNVPRIVHATAQTPATTPVAPAQPAAPVVASAPIATPTAAPVNAFAQQVTTIRDLANKLGMPMDAYYAMLAKRGVKSAAELTVEQAAELIKAMDAKLIAQTATVTAPGTPGVTIGTPLTPAAPAAPVASTLNMPIVPGSPGYITTPQAVRLSELRNALGMTDLQWAESVLRKRGLNGTHELPEADAAVIIAKLEAKLAAANPNTDPRAVLDAQKTAELTEWANGATLPKPQTGPQTAAPGPSNG